MERKQKTNEGGQRVDRYVREHFPQLSGRHIDEAIALGWVRLDGEPLKKGRRYEGADLDCALLQERLATLLHGNPKMEIPVLAETDGFWVVDKPAGIPSHPLSLGDENTVTHWALARLPDLAAEFPSAQPTITPHRLDTGTSGVLVVAKTQAAYEQWREWFSEKRVQKKYLAWCWGTPAGEVFTVETPLAHATGDRRRMVAVGPVEMKFQPPLQKALTRVKVVRQLPGAFLADVECETGVTHQVRVHLASVGHPLVGDALYDPAYASRTVRPAHQLLRAVELSSGEFRFQAPTDAFISEFETTVRA